MNSKVPTREEAFRLLTEYNKNESLIKHALAVEAVMRYFARKRGEDEDKWGVIGLIHDLDYEQFPDQHLSGSMYSCQRVETARWPLALSKLGGKLDRPPRVSLMMSKSKCRVSGSISS